MFENLLAQVTARPYSGSDVSNRHHYEVCRITEEANIRQVFKQIHFQKVGNATDKKYRVLSENI